MYKKKEEEFSLEEKDITIEVHGWTLNRFASVRPRVSFETAFGNEVLLEYLSHTFCFPSHLFIDLCWPFKNLLNRCDSQELFSGELWLLGVIFWGVVTLRSYLKSCDSWELFFEELWLLDQTWETLIFDIIKTLYHICFYNLPLFDDDNNLKSR